MCGRIIRTQSKNILGRDFGIADVSTVPDLPVSYNLPPSRASYVVGFNPEAGRRGLAVMTWGLVPRWWKKSLKGALKPANATAEGIREKPFFRDSFRKRRCIVPVSGFYEWKKGDGPYCIRPAEGETFALAGVWDAWENPDGGRLLSFAVITTTPNEVMSPIHNRMPSILPPEVWDRWLSPETSEEETHSFLGPLPADRITTFRVSTAVNSPRNDRPELIVPAA